MSVLTRTEQCFQNFNRPACLYNFCICQDVSMLEFEIDCVYICQPQEYLFCHS